MVIISGRTPYINTWKELSADKSMVFLAGPRQSGKTTLAQIIAQTYTDSLYFNWDIPSHRAQLIDGPLFFESVERRDSSRPLIVFDEIHKHGDWENYLKGVYDQFQADYQFLVSGSGRLDIYQRGGDFMAGRYLLFHLWPFTIAERCGNNLSLEAFLNNPLHISMDRKDELREIWQQLFDLSGFPEPFLSGRMAAYRRWSNTYSHQPIREDIRDLTGIKSIGYLKTFYMLLPSKVGDPLSIPSLAGDLKVSYNSVRSWLSAFERFFSCSVFRRGRVRYPAQYKKNVRYTSWMRPS